MSSNDQVVMQFKEVLAKQNLPVRNLQSTNSVKFFVNLSEQSGRVGKNYAVDSEDEFLIRVLASKQYNITAATKVYAEILSWRESHCVDSILDTPDPNEELFQRLTPHRFTHIK